MFAYVNSVLVVSDSPNFAALLIWLSIGVAGFAVGGLTVGVSLRRAHRQPVDELRVETMTPANELIAA